MTNGENRDVIGSDSIDNPVLAVDDFPKVGALKLRYLAPALWELYQALGCTEQFLHRPGGGRRLLLSDPDRNVSHSLEGER